MSTEFTSWSWRALSAGLITGLMALPLASTAQTATGTDGGQAPAAAPQVEANQAALALFLSDPAGFLTQEGDLAALIASVALADPAAVSQIVSLASAEGVSAAQAEAIGAGLAVVAGQLAAEGNVQQGAAILAAVAQSPSSSLSAGFTSAFGDVQTAAVNPATPAPAAPAAADNAPDAPAATGAADIGGGDAAAGGTPATGAGVPGGNNAGGASGSTPGGGASGGSNAGGVPGGSVSPTG